MVKKKITTNNKELYEKLNLLNFTNSVVVNNVPKWHVERTLKRTDLKMFDFGNRIIIERSTPFNFDIYFKKIDRRNNKWVF